MAYQVDIGSNDEEGSRQVAQVVHSETVPSLSICPWEHLTTFTGDYAGAQAQVAIITPSSGKRICLHCIFSSTDQVAADTVLEFVTSGIIVHKLYVSKQESAFQADMHIEGAIDEPLSLTCGAKTFVAVSYTEQD